MDLKISLFITSFIPLWFSIIFINTWSIMTYIFTKLNGNFSFYKLLSAKSIEIFFSLILIILFSIATINLYNFFSRNKKSGNKPVGIVKKALRAHNLGSDFLLAYILPMIAFNFGNLKDIILFCIIFLILGFLCIRNENIYTNIYLEFLGYQMFYVDFSKDITDKENNIKTDVLFLSKNDLRLEIGRTIEYYEINNFIYIKF